jgi:uncharacterized protein (TIGR03437 family)
MPNKMLAAAVLLLWALSSRAQTLTPNSWSMGAPMPTARQGTFTGAVGQKIYVIGGINGPSLYNVNEVYDTATNTWSTAAPMPTARSTGATAVVGNVIYTIGGANSGALSNVVEAYDPATNNWSTKAPMPVSLNSMYAAVENGIIYVLGGFNGGTRVATVLSYNPTTNSWTTLKSMNVGKSQSAVGLLGSTIIAAGGLSADNTTATTDNEGYNAATNSWTTLAPLPSPRQAGCFEAVGETLYFASGDAASGFAVVSRTDAYDATTNTWTTGLAPIPVPVGNPGSASVGGRLYCFGGSSTGQNGSGATIYNLVQIYQPQQAPPAISSGGVVSASAFGAFPSISPGSWIEIYGSNLASDTRGWTGADFNGINAPTNLDGTTVTIGGRLAFIDYISPGQVNALVPSNVPTGLQQLYVTTAIGTSAAYNVTVNAAQPGLLAPSSFNIGGIQYAVALFADGTYALPTGAMAGVSSRPAKPGEVVTLYGVGFGPVTPNIPAGQLVEQLNSLALPLQMEIGGVPVNPSYDGLAPSYTGLYQFNVTVPAAAFPSTAPLTFTLNGTSGTQTLYLSVGQ